MKGFYLILERNAAATSATRTLSTLCGLIMIMAITSLTTLAAPPANDNFANAQVIGASGGLFGTNVDATEQNGEPRHGGGGTGWGIGWQNTVWYKIVAQTNGVYTVTTTSGTLTDTLMSAYTGSAVNALTTIAESDDFPGMAFCSRVTFTVQAGQTYYIGIDGARNDVGTFGLVYSLTSSALNDNFEARVTIPPSFYNYDRLPLTSSNHGATSEANELVHEFDAGWENDSIWYEWSPDESGSVTFSTAGSTVDTVLAVYRGYSLGFLQLEGRNDDYGPSGTRSSEVTFYAQAGAPYRIAIDGYHNNTGNTRLNWRANYRETRTKMNFNFDGDQRADLAVFRPSNGQWWVAGLEYPSVRGMTFGASGDIPTAADFTGDGETDVAVFRPSTGEWFVLRSEDGSFYSIPFGTAGDIPAPGLFSHDEAADPAVFRPSNATWYIRRPNGTAEIKQFGATGDVPVVADYDGDGYSDVAVFRPSNGQWWLNRSSKGVIATTFGTSTDKPVVGDYTGDGRSDIAFWRPSSGEWFILRSENSSYYSFPFGAPGDIPAPADYNGDSSIDPTVFRSSTGVWYSNQGPSGIKTYVFGTSGDQPAAATYIP